MERRVVRFCKVVYCNITLPLPRRP